MHKRLTEVACKGSALHFILQNFEHTKIWNTTYLKSNKLPVELLARHVHELRVEPCVERDQPELIVEVELSNVMFPFPLSYHLPSQSKGRTHEPSNCSKWNKTHVLEEISYSFNFHFCTHWIKKNDILRCLFTTRKFIIALNNIS